MQQPGIRPASLLPSGEYFALRLGDQRAVVTEVGATLRSYTVAGRELLDTFAAEHHQTCWEIPPQSEPDPLQVAIQWLGRVKGGIQDHP